jgi:hypothetical protein
MTDTEYIITEMLGIYTSMSDGAFQGGRSNPEYDMDYHSAHIVNLRGRLRNLYSNIKNNIIADVRAEIEEAVIAVEAKAVVDIMIGAANKAKAGSAIETAIGGVPDTHDSPINSAGLVPDWIDTPTVAVISPDIISPDTVRADRIKALADQSDAGPSLASNEIYRKILKRLEQSRTGLYAPEDIIGSYADRFDENSMNQFRSSIEKTSFAFDDNDESTIIANRYSSSSISGYTT